VLNIEYVAFQGKYNFSAEECNTCRIVCNLFYALCVSEYVLHERLVKMVQCGYEAL